MAKIYRDINIYVGMGGNTYTRLLGEQVDVISEDSIVRLIMTFPTTYDDYSKVIIIKFTSASAVLTTESYVLNTDPILLKHYFIIDRRFTYGDEIKIQFEARYGDEQVAIDPKILTFRFKDSLYSINLQPLDADPIPLYTTTLQSMVNEHAVVIASDTVLGHVKVDNNSITIDVDGVMTAHPVGGLTPDIATDSTVGVMRTDGVSTTIDAEGIVTSHGLTFGNGIDIPVSAVSGQLFYAVYTQTLYYYTGVEWVELVLHT